MLLKKLIEKQTEMGMTDSQFANTLGVSRQLWQFTRTERLPIGLKLLIGTCRSFPELIPAVLVFLAEDASIPTQPAS